jgi:hypothetical protein
MKAAVKVKSSRDAPRTEDGNAGIVAGWGAKSPSEQVMKKRLQELSWIG